MNYDLIKEALQSHAIFYLPTFPTILYNFVHNVNELIL